MDCWAAGKALGRSVVHAAREHPATDGEPRGLSVAEQLADVRLGPLPLPLMLLGLRLTATGPQMRFVNFAKYALSALRGRHRYRQSLVAYSFLFDYLPGWNEAYRPAGFIQYQLFVPKEAAEEAFGKALTLQHEKGIVSSLAVVKRHRADRFPGGYVLDGFSLALDFPVTRRSASRLIALCRDFDALLLRCGGRAYKAKDCVGSVERLARARKTA
jgi:decaprenylphospho-beta-D-ribofuranose 2-oxidase